MKDFIRDFNKRVAEIDKYFELVDQIEQLGAFSTNSITFPSGVYTVDRNLQKILKSNCYLLLYNLIESSIRNGIVAIHDAIEIDSLTYQELSPKIQNLWLLNDRSKSFIEPGTKKETIARNLQEIIKVAIDNEHVVVLSNVPISRNLDAKTIKELVDMYGFYGTLGVASEKIDKVLDFVVEIRCDLAHGNYSFSDASNEIIWNRSTSNTDDQQEVFRYLIDDKESVVRYLTHMLQNISNFIDNKKYKRSQSNL